MVKPVLIALATLITFDAAVWRGEVRTSAVAGTRHLFHELASLDWDLEKWRS
jgi:hypothetical protein